MRPASAPELPRAELSIATSFNYEIPIDVQILMIADAGFTHVSLGASEPHSGYRSASGRGRLLGLLQRQNLRLDTIHGPRLDQPDGVEALTATAEAAADLGASVVVTHPGPFDFRPEQLPARLAELRNVCAALEPIAARTGASFALENVLPLATDLTCQILPQLDPRYFGFCYDSSHDQIGGPRPFNLPRELGHRLVAVQLSDRIRDFVDHVIPGEGFIDWDTLASVLRGTSFRGPLLFEVAMKHSAEQDPLRFLQRTYACGLDLHERIYGAVTIDDTPI